MIYVTVNLKKMSFSEMDSFIKYNCDDKLFKETIFDQKSIALFGSLILFIIIVLCISLL